MVGMRTTKPFLPRYLFGLLLLVFFLTACANNATPDVTEPPAIEEPAPSPTPQPPTATPIPAAAVVNGERIPLVWFEAEVDRFILAQEAQENTDIDQALARHVVLEDLISQTLLAQGAREAGISVSSAELQGRLDTLAADVDLDAWMAEWGYSQDELFEILNFQVLAAYQRDRVINTVPEEMEHVEIRQVFAFTPEGAERARVSLNSGTDFEEVAFRYDPTIGGYLGWVPRGYLLIEDVEDAAFDLPVGAYSDIIESDIGYHIVMVLDRAEHPLSHDARLTLQRRALHDWLEEQRQNSTIEILVE